MRINRIRIENWRGVRLAEIRPDAGVTVVYGSNEAGKSSLMEAMHLALTEPAEANRKALRDLMPWGTALKARVDLEFADAGGQPFRISKAFPKGDSTLFRLVDGGAVPVAEGREAQRMLWDILHIDAETAGLYDLLWISQGETLAVLGSRPVPGKIAGWIRDAVRANLISPKTEEFYTSIRTELSRTYTTTGKLKKGCSLEVLRNQYQDAVGKSQHSAERVREVEAESEEFFQLGIEIEKTEKEQGRHEARVRAIRKKRDAYEQIRPLMEAFRRKETAYREITEKRQDLHDLAGSLPGRIARKRALLRARISATDKRLSEQEAFEEELSRIDTEMAACPVTEDSVVRRLEILARQVKEAGIRLDSSALRISSRLLGDAPEDDKNGSSGGEGGKIKDGGSGSPAVLEVSTDDGLPFDYSIGGGEISASRRIALRQPGSYELVCTGPLSEAEWTRVSREERAAAGELRKILEEYGVDTVDAARASVQRYLAAKSRRSELLGKSAASERLRSDREALSGMLAAAAAEQDAVLAVLTKAGDLEAMEAASRGFDVEAAAAPEPAGSTEAGSTESEMRELERNVTRDIERLSAAADRLLKLLEDSAPDDYRRGYIEDKERIKIETERIAAMDPMEVDASEPSAAAAAEKELEKAGQALTALRLRHATLEGRLSNAGDPWAQKEYWDRRTAAIASELSSEEVRIDSARLLLDLMDTRKEELERNLAEPVSRRLARSFRMVTSDGYSHIDLQQDFSIASISSGDSLPIPHTDLSYGTKEQLAFLFRLVLAEYLSEKEAQTMVLDDSFVNTDRHRLGRLLEIIAGLDDRLQTIIFTCHPEMYEPLRDHAVFVSMEGG